MRLTKEASGERWNIRPDSLKKVTGELKYLTDLSFPDMLYGKVLRSPYPHANILSINTEKAKELAGVVAVITHEDVPGMNRFGLVFPDQPVLCEDRVRFVGDAVAAVAAETEDIAALALKLIQVEYEILPIVSDPEKAILGDSIKLHPNGNILHRSSYRNGEAVDQILSECYVIVEETYVTPRQMHVYMETEGGIVVPIRTGGISVYAATQHGFKDRMQLARILDLPESMIRV
ncbi:MAG: xanthine dehydrogenase substrate and molybdenum cofactor subunit, partial [Bacillus sp. (in: firmicutes)]|nr:xanthine dehydrogenase substrate and molybdenum cofactor subunit [Bacillus sp. (in: firmicutes)]